MMELHDLCCGYDKTVVVRSVSTSFQPGTLSAVIGPNGSGKSTLIRTAAGILPRLSGSVLLDGEDLSTLEPKTLARKVSYMPQQRPVPNISAGKMVLHGRFPYLGYPRRYREEDYDAADQALRECDALDLKQSMLPKLSGGQQQRIYLAMILAQDTGTVFLDEPTTYLDVAHQISLMELARTLASKGKAVVIVLHDLPMAMQYADRLLLMSGGELLCSGSPDEVYTSGQLDEVFRIRFRRMNPGTGYQYYFEKDEKGGNAQ